MKKLAFLFLAIALTFSSCKKTIDEILILGKWNVINYYEDGVQKNNDFNTNFPNYQIQFKADKSFTETWNGTTVIGTWKNYNDDQKYVELIITSTGNKRIYDILDLRTKTATVRIVGNPTQVYDLTNVE